MQLANTHSRFGLITRGGHWLTAILILVQLPLGLIANRMAAALRDPSIASTLDDFTRTAFLFSAHKTLGVALFALALARIGWALSQPRPGPLHGDRRGEALLAETVYWLLYGSLVLVPLTGWISHAATPGLAPIWWPLGQGLPFVPADATVAAIAGALHRLAVRVLALSLALHVVGALKHHLIDRDATLRRMLTDGAGLPIPPDRRRGFFPLIAAIAVWAAALALGQAVGLFAPVRPQAPPAPAASRPTDWQMISGTVGFTAHKGATMVSGRFDDWTAAITFDDHVTPGLAGTLDVVIDTASLSLGPDTSLASGPDYLDSRAYPTATYLAEIERTASGLVARGSLTVRDRTAPVDLPFTLDISGDTAVARGSAHLDLRAFGIGQAVSNDPASDLTIDVDFSLSARRQN